MAFYGFSDKRIAQNLKRIGMNGVHSPSGKTTLPEVTDNGSRIFLVKPLETIPAATVSAGTVQPGSGEVEVFEIYDTASSGTTTPMTRPRTNGDTTSLKRTAYNVGFSSIPGQSAAETTELYISVEDSFGRLLISTDCGGDDSELFACLESSLSDGGSATAKVWPEFTETITVHASPLLCPGDAIDACTIVHARWFARYGKWYVVTVGSTCHCDCESGSDHSDTSDSSDQPDTSDQSDSSGGNCRAYIMYRVNTMEMSDGPVTFIWMNGFTTPPDYEEEGEPESYPWHLYVDLGTTYESSTAARIAIFDYWSEHKADMLDFGRTQLVGQHGRFDFFVSQTQYAYWYDYATGEEITQA